MPSGRSRGPRPRPGRHDRGSRRTSVPPSGERPASVRRGGPRAPSSRPRAAIRSRSSWPRKPTGSRTCCRCATAGWPTRPSRSTAAHRRSWPSTCRRRHGATSSSRPAATRTSRTSACSPRPSEHSCSTRTTSTRRCPGHGSGTSSASPRASSSPPERTASRPPRRGRRRWPRCGRTASRWLATPEMRLLDIWYDQTTADDIETAAHRHGQGRRRHGFGRKDAQARLQRIFAKARGKDRMKATASLTAVVDGQWRIVDDPPVVSHVELAGRDRRPREDLRRLPGDAGREPSRAHRALPLRRLRAQGRRRRKRRHPLLRRPPRGARRRRSAPAPGQGGDRLGPVDPTSRPATTRTTASGSSSASG